MELKDMMRWIDFCRYMDNIYIAMVKNGVAPIGALADPITFERIHTSLYEAYYPNEKPRPNVHSIEICFPNFGYIQLTRGMENNEPYIFFLTKTR